MSRVSCERSERKALSKDSYQNPKLVKNIKKYSCFTAVTVKLNTPLWSRFGTASEDVYYQIIYAIYQAVEQPTILHHIKFELDSKCQLHCHTTVETRFPIFRKKVLQFIKSELPQARNYSLFMKPIASDELEYWTAYCRKTTIDVRPLYYRIAKFYRDWRIHTDLSDVEASKVSLLDNICEDFSDLADYDVEYNSKTKHFEYIDSSKAKCYTYN